MGNNLGENLALLRSAQTAAYGRPYVPSRPLAFLLSDPTETSNLVQTLSGIRGTVERITVGGSNVGFGATPASSGSGTTSVAFGSLGSGTSTGKQLTVGSASVLGTSGTGVINANQIDGVVVTGTPQTGYLLVTTANNAASWTTVLPNGTTASTQSPLDDSTKVGTTAYTDLAVGVETARAEAAEALLAPKASPTFTGTVTAPILDVTTSMTTPSIAINGGTAITAQSGTGGTVVMTASPTFTGTVTVPTEDVTTIFWTAAGAAPTSAGTAGTAGQFIYYSGLLYFCSVTGSAGSATWNKLSMTTV
jgi:hypothetical protein